jgi:hypothetical protein
MSEMPLNFASADERQKWMLENATMFTMVGFLGAGKYHKVEFDHIEKALEWAKSASNWLKIPYMIYAVVPPYDSLVEVVYPEGQHASPYKSGDQVKSNRSRTSASKN